MSITHEVDTFNSFLNQIIMWFFNKSSKYELAWDSRASERETRSHFWKHKPLLMLKHTWWLIYSAASKPKRHGDKRISKASPHEHHRSCPVAPHVCGTKWLAYHSIVRLSSVVFRIIIALNKGSQWSWWAAIVETYLSLMVEKCTTCKMDARNSWEFCRCDETFLPLCNLLPCFLLGRGSFILKTGKITFLIL